MSRAGTGRPRRARHLTRRFLSMLWPGGPPPDDDAWARSLLLPGEERLWDRMDRRDRRHAVAVARRAAATLGPHAHREVLAGALLHDVGKITARLGVYLRVVATLSAAVAGRGAADAWARRRGVTRRIGLYLRHPELGADLLALAGSDPLTVAWAREHHRPAAEWTVPEAVGRALAAADDD